MIDQKNRMDPRPKEYPSPENEVDFELLWRRISKIRNPTHMATYTKEIENLNNKIVYKNSPLRTRSLSVRLQFDTRHLLFLCENFGDTRDTYSIIE